MEPNDRAEHQVREDRKMPSPIPGLHHVTAIASDPQRNLDFYTQVLGLRFVKRTVNFDDPGTYHFYFGDDAGSPGTILTFFPWPGATKGRPGAGEVTRTAFSVPLSSLDYWQQRLRGHGISVERTEKRFDEKVLSLSDPDGMKIELAGHAEAGGVKAPRFATVAPEYAIRGFFGVTLHEQDLNDTVQILGVMGFEKIAEEANRVRFAAEGKALGNHIDLLIDRNARYGALGAGSVHHVAFRVKDDAAQLEWRREITKYVDATPVKDRTYFHSVYFREPGGVLFELATDPPGFAYDEPLESLGEELRIPTWLEPQRSAIERSLAPITLHKEVPPLEFKTESGASI
jgi:glyoxalase family protein